MKKLMLFFVLLFLLVLSACENPIFIEASGLYTVSFETNGGTEIQSFRTDKITSSPKTQKEGEDFAGWYTSSRFVEEVSFPFELSKDITLYAKWEEHIEPYSVSFDSNGGTEVETFYGSVIFGNAGFFKERLLFRRLVSGSGFSKSGDFSICPKR